ncbi:hypothetical protein [Litorilituus lipolyticus]|uniref:Solute-binding protein family 3/N-terminal domain-containing protein n=1 Tax=Litorilituus lipolyticus TaxID=2491017 RepID=A0A502KL51_9GAMM|nr:hypothetical protein [Litorilituus lipolyticus]TPH12176.1 hypothetical protein EPA86_17670 [Litorilituus lipolyticus]
MQISGVIIRFSIFILLGAFSLFVDAAKIQIHSDNAFDVESLLSLSPTSLSVESNLAVLELPDKNLSLALVPFKRSLKFMEDGQSVCVLNRIKTEKRAKEYLFSYPVNIFINRRLYQLADLAPLSSSPVDLSELFNQFPSRRLIVSSQLSYGDELDKIIKDIPKKNIIVRDSGSQNRGVIEMFLKKRAEYALFTPQEFVGEGYEFTANSYEIKHVEPYIVGHVMCAPTVENEAFIKQVNAKIQALVKDQTMYNIHLNGMSPRQQDYFRSYYQRVYQDLLSSH